jgi:hypothetical protein
VSLRETLYPEFDPIQQSLSQNFSGDQETNRGDDALAGYTEEQINSVNAENMYHLDLKLRQQAEYVEIPLILQYKIIDQKLDVKLNGGINTGILVSNTAIIQNSEHKFWDGKTNELNQFVYNASFGLGIEYPVSNKISLNLEPTFRYTLNSHAKSSDVFDYPYRFGVFTGVNYMF